jgi:hypothetical protein
MLAWLSPAARAQHGRAAVAFALLVLPVYASCTKSEDTEPFVPAQEGAFQPEGGGDLISEEEACDRIAEAESEARERLSCNPELVGECPGYIRPGAGSGCYEYSASSVAACEEAYDASRSCAQLQRCVVSATLNLELETCQQAGEGGAAGAGGGGGALGGAGGEAGSLGGAGGDTGAPLGGAGQGTGGAPDLGGSGGTAGTAGSSGSS